MRMKVHLLILQFFVVGVTFAQQYALELNYQFGTNIAIHPKYPTIETYSHAGEITLLQHSQGNKIWTILYGQPTVAYSLSLIHI